VYSPRTAVFAFLATRYSSFFLERTSITHKHAGKARDKTNGQNKDGF